jgi:hypothetical protein
LKAKVRVFRISNKLAFLFYLSLRVAALPEGEATMSDNPQIKDPRSILPRFEKDWQELRELLRLQQMESDEPQQLDLQPLKEQGNLDEMAETLDDAITHPLPKGQTEARKLSSMGTITPMEVEAIVQGVEKVHRDAEVLERLARVEKQSRRIALLGSMFLTILALAMGLFAFLMVQSHLFDKISLFPAAQGIIQPKSADSGSTEKEISTKQPEAEAFKYVGSETSNKYHYPDCKWAKTIVPERLITFKSVKEAQEAGYKPCPTCKPPVSEGEGSKSEQPH